MNFRLSMSASDPPHSTGPCQATEGVHLTTECPLRVMDTC